MERPLSCRAPSEFFHVEVDGPQPKAVLRCRDFASGKPSVASSSWIRNELSSFTYHQRFGLLKSGCGFPYGDSERLGSLLHKDADGSLALLDSRNYAL